MPNTDDTLVSDAIVLLVDHQHGIAERAQATDGKHVDKSAASLAKAAKIFDIPIVVSVIDAMGPPVLTHALREALGDDVVMHARQGSDSLDNAEIAAAIERTGRRTVLIAGIVTEIAVQRSALHAMTIGYRTQVVLDACNGSTERSERAAILRMTQAGVEMTSVPVILGALARDFADPRAQQALALLMGG
jgi:nicotinamidase-related amidase